MHIRKKQNPNDLSVKLFDIMNNRTSEEAFPFLTASGLLNVTKFLENNDQCDTNDGPILCRFPEYSYNITTNFSLLYAQNVAFSDIICSDDKHPCPFDTPCKFTNSSLVSSWFNSAKLNCLSFLETDLSQANFLNAKLNLIEFNQCNLQNTQFDNCNIHSAEFSHSFFNNTSLANTTVIDVGIRDNTGENISFHQATLADVSVYRNRFSNMDFSNSHFTLADEPYHPKIVLFYETNIIKNVNFNDANLERATILTDFLNSTFQNAHFKNSFLQGNFANSNFKNTTFIFDHADYPYLEYSNFSNVNLCNITLINDGKVIINPRVQKEIFRERGANVNSASFCYNGSDSSSNINDSSSSEDFLTRKGIIPTIAIGSVVIAFFAFLAILAIGYIIFRKQIHEYANQMAEKRRQEKLSAKENAEIEEKVARLLNLQAKHYDALNDDVGLPNELIQQILSYSFSEQVIQQTVRSLDYRNDEMDENNDEENLSFLAENKKDEQQQRLITRAFNALEEQRHGKLVLSSQKGLLPSLSLFNTAPQRTTPLPQQHKRCQLY